MQLLTCQDAEPDCYFNRCEACSGDGNLRNVLEDLLITDDEPIIYKSWVTKPCCTLITKTCSREEFVEDFCDQAKSLLQHSFIAKQQSGYQRFVKDNLAADECIVICDFAENYAFVVQDAAPGFHWNNKQATVYPVVLYYRSNGILSHSSIVMISDCLEHDAVTVWAFSRFIVKFAKGLVPCVSKLIYFSDGAPQQFKNYKNFINIYNHEHDFGVRAEWHFFATPHGKGPCDGIGGTLKRMAARASLQRTPDQQILEPKDLFDWANTPNTLPSITVRYWHKENYAIALDFLSNRFEQTRRIPHTQQVHCVIPKNNYKLAVKDFSFSNNETEHNLKKKKR